MMLGSIQGRRFCNVIDEKVAHGTRDFYKEPAMDETQMRQALQCGLDAVYACKCDNLDYVCIGEMGIGNTTTSSAVAAALLQKKAEEVTGRGAGLDDVKLQKRSGSFRRPSKDVIFIRRLLQKS